MAFTSFKV
ncbi:hypothetical protein S40293_09581 [Stachybotrys chartarum IBT 40293]|nr:hypothetical protein S40293_09581 [Stachybotrys chartarum IBT 40293]